MVSPTRSPSAAAGAAAGSAAAAVLPRKRAGSVSRADRRNNSRRLSVSAPRFHWLLKDGSMLTPLILVRAFVLSCFRVFRGFRGSRFLCFSWSHFVSDNRDHVDLDQRVAGNAAGRRNRRPHRRLGAKAPLEHLVHAGVVLQVVQVDVTLQDLFHRRSRAFELLLDLI